MNSQLDNSKNRITIVSGPPRSGTSLMMKMLEMAGLPILTDKIRSADEEIGWLVYSLKYADTSKNTYLVIMSDHRQLFEREIYGHLPLRKWRTDVRKRAL